MTVENRYTTDAILLDTNILLRQAEPLHAQHAESATAADALRRDGNQLVIVPQVLYEFWSVATRAVAQNGLGMTAVEARAEVIAIQRFSDCFVTSEPSMPSGKN